ncbi:MAG: peptide-methionine (R)-S-oxide reductase [Spirochaetae bacterium HGW-Spirochaetae-1]|nr:MAG: peptide-methionine (R)-S-oxide reductase [Spirochaetae bacterium HGW-Spirochaetae-1]
MRKAALMLLILLAIGLTRCDMKKETRHMDATDETVTVYDMETGSMKAVKKIEKSDAEWKTLLPQEQFDVLRRGGTECAFTGEYDAMNKKGIYRCAACGNDLFRSDDKFHSGTGWPSFTQAVNNGNVTLREDRSHGMVRNEVLCAVCGGHLGHVFNDGPAPTGNRFCMNSAAMKFFPEKE